MSFLFLFLCFATLHADQKSNTDALFEAIEKGDAAKVYAAIKSGIKKNIIHETGDAPIHYAIRNNKLHIVKLFVKEKGTVRQKNKNGQTPLYYATWFNHPEIALLLLQNGADPNELSDNA